MYTIIMQVSGSDQELGDSERDLQDSKLQTLVEGTAAGMCIVISPQ